MNLLEHANARTVESQSVGEHVGLELSGWNRKVLPNSGQVNKPEIHNLNA